MATCMLPTAPTSFNYCQAPEVQVPSLGIINIRALRASRRISPMGFQRPSRPSLQHIDTSIVSRLAVPEEIEQGHRLSRSFEDPGDTLLSPAVDALNSAISGSFIYPSSKEVTTYQQNAVAPLPGLYISQSSRRNPTEWRAGASISPTLRVLSPLTPSTGPSSPVYEISEDAGEAEDERDSEDAWNLIPYDISWGSSYYGYRDGTLPGPHGKCVFLRSPTPLKYQRTGQACEKCRERKARCSGTRPFCTRCIARGHACEYAPEAKRSRLDDSANDKEEGNSFSSIQRRSGCQSPVAHRRVAMATVGRLGSITEYGTLVLSATALRRRHSTIELPVSLPVAFSNSTHSALREPRLAGRTDRSSESRFLGSLVDPSPSITGSGGESFLVEDLQPTYRAPGSYPAHSHDESLYISTHPSFSSESLARIDVNNLSQFRFPRQEPQQTELWTPLSRSSDATVADIHQSDAFDASHEPNALRNSASIPELSFAADADGFVHSTPDTGDTLDYNITDVSPVSMSGQALWSSQSMAQPKTDTEASAYPFDIAHPHMDIMMHSPDFFSFDPQRESLDTVHMATPGGSEFSMDLARQYSDIR